MTNFTTSANMSFEEWKAYMQDLSTKHEERLAKIKEETDRTRQEAEEARKKHEERLAKLKEEVDESKKYYNREIGKIFNLIGTMTEAFFQGEVYKLFVEHGYHFDSDGGKKKFFDKETGLIVAEVDNWLENGDYVLAVEVKTRGTSEYVKEHLEKLQTIRAHLRNENRKLIGAVAALTWDGNSDLFAQRQGLYVININEEILSLKDAPEGWQPKPY